MNVVLFVAALSEYNQVLYEDQTQNCLTESIQLFEEVCKNKWLQAPSLFLFLNKRDLFQEKLQKFPLGKYFTEFTAENTYENASQWIQEQFLAKNTTGRKVYTFIASATEKLDVQSVIDLVRKTFTNKVALV